MLQGSGSAGGNMFNMKIINGLIFWMIGIIIGIGTVYYACMGRKKSHGAIKL